MIRGIETVKKEIQNQKKKNITCKHCQGNATLFHFYPETFDYFFHCKNCHKLTHLNPCEELIKKDMERVYGTDGIKLYNGLDNHVIEVYLKSIKRMKDFMEKIHQNGVKEYDLNFFDGWFTFTLPRKFVLEILWLPHKNDSRRTL
jgi:hypothetical protein